MSEDLSSLFVYNQHSTGLVAPLKLMTYFYYKYKAVNLHIQHNQQKQNCKTSNCNSNHNKIRSFMAPNSIELMAFFVYI